LLPSWFVPALAQAPASRPTGFLSRPQMPDVLRIVPAAPAKDDSRFAADIAIYRATRSLEGSPRWAMALSDDDVSTAGLLKAMRCALGVEVTRENAPLVATIVARANVDATLASTTVKQFYKHPRPYQVLDAPVCVPPATKARLANNSPDYPSGHTIASWETGLVLSEVAPDRTTELLARARAFGESRVVCGVHNLSAVEAGWVTASAVFAAQQSSDAFQAALRAAKEQFAIVRKRGSVDPVACAAETAILAKDPF
jgi:acid phosphatase (class A)